MSPDQDEPQIHERDFDEPQSRSIFAATWFRVVLVLIVVLVIGAVAWPYVSDWMSPAPPKTAVLKPPPPRSAAPAQAPAPTPAAPSAPTPGQAVAPVPPAPPAAQPPKPVAKLPPKAEPAAKPAVEPKAAPKPAEPRAAPPRAPLEAKAAPATAEVKPAPKPAVPAKPEPRTKAESDKPAKAAETKPAPVAREVAKVEPPRTAAPAVRQAVARAAGGYWVQVGAFKNPETARQLAAKLRGENFNVEEPVTRAGAPPAPAAPSPPPPAAPAPAARSDQYDVYVSGLPVDELSRRMTAKGLAVEPAGKSVVIKPSLPLRDAVAISKDLAMDGFKVQVRRAGAGAPGARPPARAESGREAPGAQSALTKVRVGPFSDRAAALAAQRDLEAKGYKPFISRGE